jgi:hypothetical protein
MHSRRAWIPSVSACALLALLTVPSFAEIPELERGRTLAVVVRSVNPIGPESPDLASSVRTRLEGEIAKWKWFRVVDDPAKADLVCLAVLYAPQMVERRKKTQTVTVGSSIIILKGGTTERWDAVPLWMVTLLTENWDMTLPRVLDWFHREAAKGTQQPRRPAAAREAGDGSAETTVFVTCPERYGCPGEDWLPPGGGPWRRVDDPSGAHLVVVWFGASTQTFVSGVATLGIALYKTQQLAAFLTFRGDAPDWSATPLIAVIRPTASELRQPLEEVLGHLAQPAIRSTVRAEEPPPASSTPLAAPQSERATIYIARDSDYVGKRIAITLDGQTAFDIAASTYGRITVAPGAHSIAASTDRSRDELPLVTEAGGVYYVKVETQFGTLSSRVVLKQVGGIDSDRLHPVLSLDF